MADGKNTHAVFDKRGTWQGWVASLDGLPEGYTVEPAPEGMDLEFTTWDTKNKCWIKDTAKAELYARSHANAFDASDILTGDWKPVVYAAKADEVNRWRGATNEQREEWINSGSKVEKLFPFLYHDGEINGGGLDEAYQRFAKGMITAQSKLAKVEAEHQRDIRIAKEK